MQSLQTVSCQEGRQTDPENRGLQAVKMPQEIPEPKHNSFRLEHRWILMELMELYGVL